MGLYFNTQTAVVQVYAWGAGGGGGTFGGWIFGAAGGGGGFASGKFVAQANQVYHVVVGGGGIVNHGGMTGNGYLGFTEGGGSTNYGSGTDNRYASGGGGYSGVFLNVPNTQPSAMVMAGGGGGGGASRGGVLNIGGAGGGVEGQRGLSAYDNSLLQGGGGGTQTSAGPVATGQFAGVGRALFGGRPTINSYGGGGGGGYFGGSSGSYNEANIMSGGGGGSGFVSSSTVFCGVLITGCLSTPACSPNPLRGGRGQGGEIGRGGLDGRVVIVYPGPQIANGGTVTTSSGNTIHTFDRSGIFALYGAPYKGLINTDVEMLLVGGGGGGGTNMGGGGGGGAVVSVYSTLTTGAYLVNVGDGGRGNEGESGLRGCRGGHTHVVLNSQYSYSYYFDNPSDLIFTTSTNFPVAMSNVMHFSNALGSQNFTIEGWYWFNDGSVPANRTMYANYLIAGFAAGFVYFGKHVGYNGLVTFWAGSHSTAFPMLIDPVHPPTGQWVHYAVSRNTNNFTLFRNGVAVAASTTATGITPNTVASVLLGNLSGGGVGFGFRGYMSNVRVTQGNSVYTTGVSSADTSTVAYSAVFNGTTDYLTVPDAAPLRVGSNSFTVESWVNMPRLPQGLGTANAYTILQKGNITSSTYEWSLSIGQNTALPSTYNILLQSTAGGSGAISTSTSAAVPITSSTWAHVAVSVSAGTANFWFNGVSAGTSAFTVPSGALAGPVAIGGSDFGTNLYQGYISNLRLNVGSADYLTAFTPSTTPLTRSGTTVLLTLQNSTFVDNANN